MLKRGAFVTNYIVARTEPFVYLVTLCYVWFHFVDFVTVAGRNRWSRRCWRTGCRCACIRILKRTSTSHCSCCTKPSSTRPRKDPWTLWRPRHDTHCLRIGCCERKLRLEHRSADVFYIAILCLFISTFQCRYTTLHFTSVPSVLWHCCWLGSKKGIRPVKNKVVRCWRGDLSEARCKLAYGPADATATHCLLLQ